MSASFEQLARWASKEVECIVAALPAELCHRAKTLPVTYEPLPNLGLQEDGIDSDTLGLFVGPEFSDEETTAIPLPPQIILFMDNLWDFAGEDEAAFKQEVRTTFMHELGHYLGLDEEDLFDRGLD